MKVQIVNKSTNPLPKYAKPGDAGMDLMADFSQGINDKFLYNAAFDEVRNVLIIFSGGRALVPTNIYTAIPEGYEMQIRSRSGLALKEGVFVLNSPGTIDPGYRNAYGVVLMNLTDDVFEIEQGDRIAQAILHKFETIEWNQVETLDETERGLTGFGDSGVKTQVNEN